MTVGPLGSSHDRDPGSAQLIGVGHKGADALAPGNTIESFSAAAALGVEMIEFDVLWLPDGDPKQPPADRSEMVIAHDYADAARRTPLRLDEALAALAKPPLQALQFDLDIKLPGREEEIAAALRRHGLLDRATFSGAHLATPPAFRAAEPSLRRGWTYPHVKRAWDQKRWAKSAVSLTLALSRRRLPTIARRRIREFDLWAIWVFHRMISPALVAAVHTEGAKLFAWTVDDPAQIEALTALGVDGIVSNDPRLFGVG